MPIDLYIGSYPQGQICTVYLSFNLVLVKLFKLVTFLQCICTCMCWLQLYMLHDSVNVSVSESYTQSWQKSAYVYANNISADQHMHPRYIHLVYLILHKRVTFANRLLLSLWICTDVVFHVLMYFSGYWLKIPAANNRTSPTAAMTINTLLVQYCT